MHLETQNVAVRSFCYTQLHTINEIAQSTNSTIVMIAGISFISHKAW